MKKNRLIIALLLAVVLVITFTACGNKDDEGNDEVVEETISATPVPETAEQALPEADTKATVDALLGEWVDIGDATRFAKITKTDSAYEYEDNEGKYPATFEEGMLKVTVGEGMVADVFIQPDTSNMVTKYEDNISEFKKK
jgi:hypothetical protein